MIGDLHVDHVLIDLQVTCQPSNSWRVYAGQNAVRLTLDCKIRVNHIMGCKVLQVSRSFSDGVWSFCVSGAFGAVQ